MSVTYHGKRLSVIDAHVHTFPDKVAPAAVGRLQKISGLTPATDGTFDKTLQKMKECGVDRSFLLNIATAPHQQTTINNCAAENNRLYDDRITAFGSVHFEAEDAIDELARIQALGLPGIKLHPDYQEAMIDDERLFPIYEKCEELGLIVVFHAGWDCYSPELVHAPPKASLRVHRRFPAMKMVLAHFGGLKRWEEVAEYLIGEDVWLDTAMCNTYGDSRQIEELILRHPADKVLLGSDCPWENPTDSIQFVLEMERLSDEQKAAILADNAKRLVGLL